MGDLQEFPVEDFDFDEEAAGNLPEWERLLADADATHQANFARLAELDDDQLTALAAMDYSEYKPAEVTIEVEEPKED